MRHRACLLVAALVLTVDVAAAAARPARGLAFAGEEAHVAAVEIVQHDTGAPPAFAEGLRSAMLAEAGLYGAAGQPVVLKVDLDRVRLKNPVKSMLIGDNSITAGHVAVVDQASGQTLGSFAVRVDAERHRGASIAMAVVGAIDPTGYVDIATTVGGAGAAVANRSGAEIAMSANFAEEALRQTFGDARAKAAHRKRP
jgi:hypothetical protein